MAAYIVMTPPHADPDGDDTVFVRDGFAWLAFVLPVVWFAFHRMWLWAAGFLVVALALSLAGEHTGWPGTAFVLALLVNLWAGLEAGPLRVGALRRRGWQEADVVVAPDRTAAEAIHFANVPAGAALPAGPAPAMAPGLRPLGSGGGPVLGLFDHGDR